MNRSSARLPFAYLLPAVALCLSLLGAASAGAAGAGADYTLTRQYGTVMFRVLFQDYLFMVGRFNEFSGTLHLDPADLSSTRMEATVNMASLDMADTDVAETLVNSASWFNASLYPEASFVTNSAEVTGENEVDLVGELTFMGMTRPWTLHAVLFGGSDGELEGSAVGMRARGSFTRSAFGLDQYMNMAADEVEIEVNVRFNRD